jgi:C1A family cysteine protease
MFFIKNKLPFDVRNMIAPTKVYSQGKCDNCWLYAIVSCFTDVIKYHIYNCKLDINNYNLDFDILTFSKNIKTGEGDVCYGGSYILHSLQKFINHGITNTRGVTIYPHNIDIVDNNVEESIMKYGPHLAVMRLFDEKDSRNLENYKGGIYGCDYHCWKDNSKKGLLHSVVIYGWGSQKMIMDDKICNIDYWIVKNSWGEQWGEKGYFKIRKGINCCGIETLIVRIVFDE